MGVRFACHVCAKPLNIKQELAGRRGVCPGCGVRFRIPLADAERSTPLIRKASGGAQATGSAAATPPATPSKSESMTSPPHLDSAVETSAQPRSVSGKQPSFDPLGDAAISTWYVRPPSGGQYGPATTDVLRQWIKEGRVAATALLWREGWAQWREARELLPKLADDLAAAASTSAPNAAAFGNRAPAEAKRLAAETPISTTTETSSVVSTPGGMIGDPVIGKARRERSFRRALTIGILSIVSLTLIVALVMVVRNSS